MAAVNFPDSPSDGDTQDVGGITYTYSSSKGYWTAAAGGGGGGGGGASVTTDDSAPGSPSDGDLWYDTDDGGMFVYYQDTDSSQWVEVIGSQGAAGPAGADGGAGVASVYATVDALPTSGNTQGDMAHVTANNTLYFWNGSGWYKIALINTNPSISGVASSYSLAIDGTATTVTITASDPEGLPITYSIASDTSGNIATVAQGTGASTNVFTITPSTNTAYAGSFTLTFRASDGVNIATAPATFTLQFSVQNQNYTTALITSVGSTNNGTNSSFDDKSTSNHTLTAAGAAHQTTFSPYRHGGYSTFFDGTGDFLSVADHADFEIGSGDFTMEAWIYLTGYSNSYGGYYAGGIMGKDSSGNRSFTFSVQATSNSYTGLQLYLFNGGTATSTIGTASMGLNQWYHVAATRSSGTVKLFLNGTQIQSGTNSTNVDNLSAPLVVGASSSFSNYEYRLKGYMRDARFINGTAVYTSGFTPPTEPLTAITNTKLLTCHLPYFADGSTNAHTITISGDTHMQPFSPYDAQEYATGSHGGSISLDGSGDSISAAASADFGFGTGDFTVEWWSYFDSISNYEYHIDMRSADNDTPLSIFTRTNLSNEIGIYVSNSVIASGTYSFVPKRWTHYAICKTGGYLKGYFNGKQDFSISCTRDYGSSESIRIGAVYGNNNYYTTGNIADVRIVKGTAVYTSAFTPPTAPLTAITNTKLLVQSTDASIIDKAQGSRQTELIGTVSSTTETKYYNSSIYFDGSNDYIELKDMPELPGPFTIEMWIWVPSGTVSQSKTFFTIGTTSSSGNCLLIYRYSNTNKIGVWNGGSTILASSTAIPQTQWAHLALTRNSSNTINVWIDGVDKGSVSNSSNFIPGTHGIKVGSENPLGYYFNGYMSDVRITKGLARYTSAFTPPAAALQG